MEIQGLNTEQKLHVILCGPLPQTERALLRRGDVEIYRDKDNLNLLIQMKNNIYDCDMIIVECPYGHGLYSMTYPVREDKDCPVWMVADPPEERVWEEINWQLDHMQSRNKAAKRKAVRGGPPGNEVLILTDDPQRRDDLTGWTREIFAGWGMTPEITAPEDQKDYQRAMPDQRGQEKPPLLVVIALPGVDSLNTAEFIRDFYPKTGLVWCCDLNFALQAYALQADDFFLMNEINRKKLAAGLDRWQSRTRSTIRIEVAT